MKFSEGTQQPTNTRDPESGLAGHPGIAKIHVAKWQLFCLPLLDRIPGCFHDCEVAKKSSFRQPKRWSFRYAWRVSRNPTNYCPKSMKFGYLFPWKTRGKRVSPRALRKSLKMMSKNHQSGDRRKTNFSTAIMTIIWTPLSL